jgi:hypothetical protein
VKKLILTSVVCLLAGIIPAQADNLVDSQGILQLPEGFSLEIYNPDKKGFTVHSGQDSTRLPYGHYTVEAWNYEKKDAEGKTWKIQAWPKDDITFTIGAKPVSLKITPEPITATAKVYGDDEYRFSLRLTAPANERCYLYCDGKRAQAPKLEIVNADKSFSVTLSSSYG